MTFKAPGSWEQACREHPRMSLTRMLSIRQIREDGDWSVCASSSRHPCSISSVGASTHGHAQHSGPALVFPIASSDHIFKLCLY